MISHLWAGWKWVWHHDYVFLARIFHKLMLGCIATGCNLKRTIFTWNQLKFKSVIFFRQINLFRECANGKRKNVHVLWNYHQLLLTKNTLFVHLGISEKNVNKKNSSIQENFHLDNLPVRVTRSVSVFLDSLSISHFLLSSFLNFS